MNNHPQSTANHYTRSNSSSVDLENKNFRLFHQNIEYNAGVVDENGDLTEETFSTLPMGFSPGSAHIAFDGADLFFTQKMDQKSGDPGLIKSFNWQDGQVRLELV